MKLYFIIAVSVTSCVIASTLPLNSNQEDSPISIIAVPYAPYTTQLVKNSRGKTRKVYVPEKMDIAPRINLKEGQIAMGSQKGVALKLAEGAYPVYYMSGNVNGQFQDKGIYLLE